MVFNKLEKQERQYLKQILDTIKGAIGNTEAAAKERVKTLNEQKQYLWDNKDIDPHEIRQVRENILNIFAIGENVIARKERLSRMLDIPYFGRIDFREDKKGSQIQPIYIGVHSFYDFDTQTSLIYIRLACACFEYVLRFRIGRGGIHISHRRSIRRHTPKRTERECRRQDEKYCRYNPAGAEHHHPQR